MTELLPLILSINRTSSRSVDPFSYQADIEFSKQRPIILERDNYKCRFCGHGFKGIKFLEAHHRDGRYRNNVPSNLVTACILCHLIHHLGWVGRKGLGDLIYFPELTQAELNHLQRTAWIVDRSNSKDIKSITSKIQEVLRDARLNVEKKLGSYNPADLASCLGPLPKAQYDARDQYLSGIRILYRPIHFTKQIDHWASLIQMDSVDSWAGMAKRYFHD